MKPAIRIDAPLWKAMKPAIRIDAAPEPDAEH
jgi:hypothetical protein